MDELTENEIFDRLQTRPDLMERFKAGDLSALAEIVEAGTGARVVETTVRLLA